MAGLAATVGTASSLPLAAVAAALRPRGDGHAGWRVGPLQLAVRAALPAVVEFPGGAMIVDGIAAGRALADRYAAEGAAGLLTDPGPYALILADLARGVLVLARNGAGPALYWARHDGAVLVASEPAALLAAGVPAAPDTRVVDRFLATGECDTGPETFFAGIRRLLPGELRELPGPAGSSPGVRTVQPRALGATGLTDRIGVRLGAGPESAAMLHGALRRSRRPRPLPVFSVALPAVPQAPDETRALRNVPAGAVRHRQLQLDPDQLDIDGYLRDLGEPTPLPADLLLWACARAAAGEVDVLLDPARGGGHLDRLADRLASRFGVGAQFPLRALTTGSRPAPGPDRFVRELLLGLRDELVAAHVHARYRARSPLLRLMTGGRRGDPAAGWRRFLVERWLRCVVHPPAPAPEPAPPVIDGPLLAGGAAWLRLPVRTELFTDGDKIPEKLAWYAGEALAGLSGHPADPALPDQPERTWYLLVAATPVAVMQGRARSVRELRPGLTARLLRRLLGRRTGLRTGWAMQVALTEVGRGRMLRAAVWAGLGGTRRYRRLIGAAGRAVRDPREAALPPGPTAVVPAPAEPDRVAAEVAAGLRVALPDALHRGFRGCAVVTDEPLGWAGHRPGGAGEPPPPDLLKTVGAAQDRTPVVLLICTGQPPD